MCEDREARSDVLDLGDYPEVVFTSFSDCYRVGTSATWVVWDWRMVGGILRKQVTGLMTRRTIVDLRADHARALQCLAGGDPGDNARGAAWVN